MNVLKSLSDIYVCLSQLEIKTTPSNTKMLTGVFVELENMISEIQEIERASVNNDEVMECQTD